VRTDWGASLFGTIVGDLFCLFHAMPLGLWPDATVSAYLRL